MNFSYDVTLANINIQYDLFLREIQLHVNK